MHLLSKSILLISIWLASNLALSEDKQTVHFLPNHVADVLGNKTVTAIHKTQRGLWIGTQSGLYIYDGEQLIPPQDHDPNNEVFFGSMITDFAETQSGDLFISTLSNGLAIFHSIPDKYSYPDITASREIITSILIDEYRNLWIGGDRGISVHAAEGLHNITDETTKRIGTTLSRVSTMVEGKFGHIWIGTDQGLVVHNSRDNTSQLFCATTADNCDALNIHVTALGVREDGAILAGNRVGAVLSISPHIHRIDSLYSSGTSNSALVTTLFTANGHYWIGTDAGLFLLEINTGDLSIYNTKNSNLSNNHVTHALTSEDQIWIGTYSGISLATSTGVETFNTKNSGIFNEVLSFAEDDNGVIWVGTYKGVFSLDEKTGLHNSLAGDNAHAADVRAMSLLALDKNLFIGTRGQGLALTSFNKKNSAIDISELENASITRMTKDHEGSVWISTLYQGILRIQDAEIEDSNDLGLTSIFSGSESFFTLATASDQEILAGTESELFLINIEKLSVRRVEFRFEEKEKSPVIISTISDKKGTIWMGTLGQGLYQLPYGKSTAKKMGHQDNRTAETVYEIQMDESGRIWSSSSEGIIVYSDTGHYMGRLGIQDGMQGPDFNFGASFKDSSGRLYFGGSNGYSRFKPDNITLNKPQPPMKFTNVYINGDKITLPTAINNLQVIELRYTDYHFALEFNVEEFFTPKNTNYSHSLQGFDPKVIETGNRGTATYTNLPPGKYTFHAQGTNSAGIRNEKGIKIQVLVHPPPWRTWWAYTLYGAAALFLFWLAWRWYYTYRLKEEAMTMARKMTMEAEYALDELQEQLEVQDSLLSSIHSRNVSGLELLRDISSRADHGSGSGTQSHSQRSISALASLEDALLHQQDRLYADMQRCVEDIAAKLLEQHQEEATSISVINEVSVRPVEAGTGSLMAVAIYELLDNAIVHTSKARAFGKYIKIALSISEPQGSSSRLFELSVSDNGEGGSEEIFSQTSGGAAVITLIAEHLNASLTVSSENGMVVTMVFSQPSSEL
ncbi:MAG: ligand-binding sensor domain-containing protein/two-component sensor histidine kinase [Alcanivorax sp.]|jgi:ligand-binding sensor domain-containing protein/two-component sensor histidine kinase